MYRPERASKVTDVWFGLPKLVRYLVAAFIGLVAIIGIAASMIPLYFLIPEISWPKALVVCGFQYALVRLILRR